MKKSIHEASKDDNPLQNHLHGNPVVNQDGLPNTCQNRPLPPVDRLSIGDQNTCPLSLVNHLLNSDFMMVDRLVFSSTDYSLVKRLMPGLEPKEPPSPPSESDMEFARLYRTMMIYP